MAPKAVHDPDVARSCNRARRLRSRIVATVAAARYNPARGGAAAISQEGRS
jgi:hypothetical protein